MYAFPLTYKMWQKIQRKRKFIPVQISRVSMIKKKIKSDNFSPLDEMFEL